MIGSVSWNFCGIRFVNKRSSDRWRFVIQLTWQSTWNIEDSFKTLRLSIPIDAGIVWRFFRNASQPNWILIRRQTELTKRAGGEFSNSHASEDIELKIVSWTKLINWIILVSKYLLGFDERKI